MTRRSLIAAGAAAAGGLGAGRRQRPLVLIEAPSHLGLRPPREGHEPGAWRAPAVLAPGLAARSRPDRQVRLERPAYSFVAQEGTRLRNGRGLRAFNEALAVEVGRVLEAGAFPLVLGGDCSIMLGCLAGLRRSGGRGLVHVDGHSDFRHPGNYDPAKVLGSAAGMDLAMATGRGEALVTQWPGVSGPLVADEDAVQLGEREREQPDWKDGYPDVERTAILQIPVQQAKAEGVPAVVDRILNRLEARSIDRAWLHLDLDVLDAEVMPAVDSPGSPGFDFAELTQLLSALIGSGRFAGLDACIYDPELDPEGRWVEPITAALAAAVAARP